MKEQDWTGNKRSIWATNGCSNHSSSEREIQDFYATDPIAIDKLITKHKIPHDVWECACGAGHLSERLKQMGYNVYSTDLVDRGYGIPDVDFTMTPLPDGFKDDCCILTNPPYKFTTEFILHALTILPDRGQAIFFLKTTALEGRKRFNSIYKFTPPKKILQFTDRILCAKSGDFDTARKHLGGGAQAYVWMIFEKGYKGLTTFDWI